ncbi:hypothetical protein LZ31DRAFT_560377, partial [Colletotrichum somersetense]
MYKRLACCLVAAAAAAAAAAPLLISDASPSPDPSASRRQRPALPSIGLAKPSLVCHEHYAHPFLKCPTRMPHSLAVLSSPHLHRLLCGKRKC